MEQIINIIGCGGHARSVADVAICNNESINISFYDVNAKMDEKMFDGRYELYSLNNKTIFNSNNLFIAIGDNLERKKYVKKYLINNDFKAISIISSNAYISKFSIIREGCFLGDGVHIGPESSIGEFSIINTNSVVEHEVIIGDYCHISVNSTICGRCRLGDNVFIGAGAIVKDYINICDDVVVGAGGVVCSDITEPGIYVGCPVKKIK